MKKKEIYIPIELKVREFFSKILLSFFLSELGFRVYLGSKNKLIDVVLKKKTHHTLINVGSGIEKSILEYAKIIAKKLDYKGKFILDRSKPNGMMRKLVDTNLAKKYGWKAKTSLQEGLQKTLVLH